MQQPLTKRYFKMEDHFHPEAAGQYDLFIELGAGITSFAIIHHETGQLTGLGSFQNPLFAVTDEFPWLRKHFNSLKVSVLNNRYTLVPSSLYIAEEKETYTAFMLDQSAEKENILDDAVEELDLHSVYAVPDRFHEKLELALRGMEIHHISGVLIRSFWVLFRSGKMNAFLNVRPEAFDLLFFEDHSLRYCNSFYFNAPEDLVYYLIFVMEQLEIDPETVLLAISGVIEEGNDLYKLIERYIRNIMFISPGESVKLTALFDDIPPHRYYSLLNMGVCGS